MRLGFVGTGVITEAIVTGLMRARNDIGLIILSPRNSEIAARLAAAFPCVRVAADNQEVVDSADVVFLAIRPQIAKDVVRALTFRERHHVVSLIAATPGETLAEWIGARGRITRAIPLPFVAELQGATAIYPPNDVVCDLFSSLGAAVPVDSLEQYDLLAAASALMGSYFGILETAASWLTAKGLPCEQAELYLRQLFAGLTQAMQLSPEASFEVLRAGHSTMGGLNEQLFARFSEHGGTVALGAALDSVMARIENRKE